MADLIDIAATKDSRSEAASSPRMATSAAPPPGATDQTTGYDLTQVRLKELRKQLASGELPEELVESWRIVDPGSPEAVIFAAECVRCAEAIAGDRLKGLDTMPRFLLADQQEANGWIVTAANPPLIVITRGMFQSVTLPDKTNEPVIAHEADLMYLIDHEINHLETQRKYPGKRNDKMEEGSGYVRPLLHLHDIGINPEIGKRFMQKLFASSESETRNFWNELLDPHPLRETTFTLIDDTLASLRLTRGDISSELRDYAGSELPLAIEQAHHCSYFDRLLLEQADLSASEPAVQLRALHGALESLSEPYGVRVEAIANALRELRGKGSEEIGIIVDDFANLLFDRCEELPPVPTLRLYTALSKVQSNRPDAPLGRLAELSAAVGSFIDASHDPINAKQLQNAAHQILFLTESEPLMRNQLGSRLLREGKWPLFELPDADRIYLAAEKKRFSKLPVVEWQSLLDFAYKNRQVCQASLLIGLYADSRFLTAAARHKLPLHEYQKAYQYDLNQSAAGTIADPPRSGSYRADDLMLDDKGKIRGLWEERSERNDNLRAHIEALTMRNQKILALDALKGSDEALAEFLRQPTANEPALLHPEFALTAPRIWVLVNNEALTVPANVLKIISRIENAMQSEPVAAKQLLEELFSPKNTFGCVETMKLGHIRAVGHEEAKENLSFERRLNTFAASLPESFLPLEKRIHIISFLAWTAERQYKKAPLQGLSKAASMITAPWLRDISQSLGCSVTDLTNPRKLLSIDQSLVGQSQVMLDALAIIALGNLKSRPKPATLIDCFQLIERHSSESQRENIVYAYLEFKTPDFVARIEKHLCTLSAEEAIEGWMLLRRNKILFSPKEYPILAELVERLIKEADAETQRKVLFGLISEDRIADYGLRERIYSTWIKHEANLLGQDDSSAEYLEKFTASIARIQDYSPRGDCAQLMKGLCRAVLGQRQSCEAVRTEDGSFSLSDFRNLDSTATAVEYLVRLLARSSKGREACLDYLLRAPTAESFTKLCHEAGMEPSDLIISDADRSEERIPIAIDGLVELGRMIHGNFWGLPLPARAGVTKELIVENTGGTSEGQISQERVRKILAKALSKNNPYFESTTRWVSRYLNASKSYERDLGLAALLTAAERGSSMKGRLRPGEALAVLAGQLGPAERKVAQAASCDPRTDPEIRADLSTSKYDIAEPPRPVLVGWVEAQRADIEEQYNRYLAKRGYQGSSVTIAWIGEVLGSASISVAVRIKLSDGTEHALALRRPYALETGERGFSTLGEMLAIGQAEDTTHARQDSVSLFLGELTAQARNRLSLEANCKIAPLQYEKLDAIARSTKVTVDGMNFTSVAPTVSAAAEDFFLMELVPGANLDRLAKEPANSQMVRNACIKTLAVELRNILSLEFDCDRHVGQIHFHQKSPTEVADYQLDAKALRLTPWSDDDVRGFARVLDKSFTSLSAGEAPDLLHNMMQTADTLRQQGELQGELVGEVLKALVSLGDYVEPLSEEDRQRALLAAIKAGIHPRLLSALAEQGSELPNILKEFETLPANGVEIDVL